MSSFSAFENMAPDILREILLGSSFSDIMASCATNRQINRLCKMDSFWITYFTRRPDDIEPVFLMALRNDDMRFIRLLQSHPLFTTAYIDTHDYPSPEAILLHMAPEMDDFHWHDRHVEFQDVIGPGVFTMTPSTFDGDVVTILMLKGDTHAFRYLVKMFELHQEANLHVLWESVQSAMEEFAESWENDGDDILRYHEYIKLIEAFDTVEDKMGDRYPVIVSNAGTSALIVKVIKYIRDVRFHGGSMVTYARDHLNNMVESAVIGAVSDPGNFQHVVKHLMKFDSSAFLHLVQMFERHQGENRPALWTAVQSAMKVFAEDWENDSWGLKYDDYVTMFESLDVVKDQMGRDYPVTVSNEGTPPAIDKVLKYIRTFPDAPMVSDARDHLNRMIKNIVVRFPFDVKYVVSQLMMFDSDAFLYLVHMFERYQEPYLSELWRAVHAQMILHEQYDDGEYYEYESVAVFHSVQRSFHEVKSKYRVAMGDLQQPRVSTICADCGDRRR